MDIYFKFIHPCHPILPKHIFLEHVWVESPFLLNSMYELASRFSSSCSEAEADKNDLLGLDFYKIARSLLDSIMDIPCLSSIWGLYLLGKYAACSGQGIYSLLYLNI